MTMAYDDLGANQFTFAGDRTKISYDTQTPIPNQGGLLQYQGPEGNDTFTGDQIIRLNSVLGTLVSAVLRPNADAGDVKITVLVPSVYGVTPGSSVTFGTIAVKTTSRGFIDSPGVELTYDVLPLVAQAHQVIQPA